MIFLGFYPTKASIRWFTDGHERDDVRYCNDVFLPKKKSIESWWRKQRRYTQRILQRYERRGLSWRFKSQLRKYTKESDYNECILPDGIENWECHYYTRGKYHIRSLLYGRWQKSACPKASKGLSLMISGFACQCHGFMEFNDEKVMNWLSSVKQNWDGAWKNEEDLIHQVETSRCKPIFIGPNFLELREWLTEVIEYELRYFIVSLILSSSCGIG